MSEASPQGDSQFEDICTFCREASGTESRFLDLGIAAEAEDYLLDQTEHFVVVPCLGALTDWYVLIVPRRHVLSTGWLDAEERAELRSLSYRTMSRLADRSGQEVVLFEHGSYSFRDKGGSCHDHSHTHIVATDRKVDDFIRHVSASVELEPCDDWIEAAASHIKDSGGSYLALESSAGSKIASANGAPSAFFRKALTSWLGGKLGEEDWLVFPQIDRLRTMVRLGL